MSLEEEKERTATHEAGHAVLHLVLGLGTKEATIIPNYEEGSAGHAIHGGEWAEAGSDAETMRMLAEETFWMRHAVAAYAGAEAVKQILEAPDADEGAESDKRAAADAINKITDDPESCELMFDLTQRRCALLVEYYRPEIEAVAQALLDHDTRSGEDVRRIVFDESLVERGAMLRTW